MHRLLLLLSVLNMGYSMKSGPPYFTAQNAKELGVEYLHPYPENMYILFREAFKDVAASDAKIEYYFHMANRSPEKYNPRYHTATPDPAATVPSDMHQFDSLQRLYDLVEMLTYEKLARTTTTTEDSSLATQDYETTGDYESVTHEAEDGMTGDWISKADGQTDTDRYEATTGKAYGIGLSEQTIDRNGEFVRTTTEDKETYVTTEEQSRMTTEEEDDEFVQVTTEDGKTYVTAEEQEKDEQSSVVRDENNEFIQMTSEEEDMYGKTEQEIGEQSSMTTDQDDKFVQFRVKEEDQSDGTIYQYMTTDKDDEFAQLMRETFSAEGDKRKGEIVYVTPEGDELTTDESDEFLHISRRAHESQSQNREAVYVATEERNSEEQSTDNDGKFDDVTSEIYEAVPHSTVGKNEVLYVMSEQTEEPSQMESETGSETSYVITEGAEEQNIEEQTDDQKENGETLYVMTEDNATDKQTDDVYVRVEDDTTQNKFKLRFLSTKEKDAIGQIYRKNDKRLYFNIEKRSGTIGNGEPLYLTARDNVKQTEDAEEALNIDEVKHISDEDETVYVAAEELVDGQSQEDEDKGTVFVTLGNNEASQQVVLADSEDGQMVFLISETNDPENVSKDETYYLTTDGEVTKGSSVDNRIQLITQEVQRSS